MGQVIELPVWLLALLLGLAWVTAWVNAWFAMRLVRRNGVMGTPAVERLQEAEAERRLLALRGDDETLPESFDGRMVE